MSKKSMQDHTLPIHIKVGANSVEIGEIKKVNMVQQMCNVYTVIATLQAIVSCS